MARIIHSAGRVIKISYFINHKFFASIAHRLLYGDGSLHMNVIKINSKINQLNLTSLIENINLYKRFIKSFK
jgi:hypothetical protein